LYDYIKIPEIIDEDKFENMTLDLYERIIDRVQKNGRRGQRQNGVDIYGYSDKNELVGLQCKVKSKADYEDKNFRLSFINEIRNEVAKATKFNKNLKIFIVMTTAPRDSAIQGVIIDLDMQTFKQNGFHVQIKFWDDIVLMLTDIEHQETFKKYYSNLIVHEKIIGAIQGKILSLIVGVEAGSGDESLYQLFLGYIPKLNSYPNGIEYYSNSYVLGCFQTRGFDTFPRKCYPSDLDEVFPKNRRSIRDHHTITDWLNSINLEEEIRNDKREYYFYWSQEEFEEYLQKFDFED
jgi:hypothetical protein